MKHAVLLIAVLLLHGCASIYDQLQGVAQANCANLSDAQSQRACEKRNAPAYDDYEARRKRLQQGNEPG